MQHTALEFEVMPSLIAPQIEQDMLMHQKANLDPRMREEKFPEQLVGDQIRLKQVLINFTKNALKFTVGGSIKIVAAYDYASEQLKVHIVDSGKGISPDEMAKVFEKFGKVSRTAS